MITVCIMSYRYGHLIAQAIESILSQTQLPSEVVIVDDGVGDVADVARRYTADFRRSGIKAVMVARRRNLGIVDNFNDVLMNSVRTPRVMFLGADNYLRPDALAILSKVKADIVSYDIALFGAEAVKFAAAAGATEIKDGYPIWRFSKRDIDVENYIHGSSLYNAELAKGYGYKASGSAQYAEEDWMLFRAMLGGGASHVHVPEPLLFYRRHKMNFQPIRGAKPRPVSMGAKAKRFYARSIAALTRSSGPERNSGLSTRL